MKITLSRKELSAALLFASTDETRFSITGIQVEMRGDQPTLIATDGRRLVVIESTADQGDGYDHSKSGLILRADFVKPLCALSKAIGGETLPWLTFELAEGSKRVQVQIVGREFFVDAHDGGLIEAAFPDWRAVIPPRSAVRSPLAEIALNAEMVGDFAKAAKLMGSSTSVVQFNIVDTDQKIEVKLSTLDNFYGLLMPCRLDTTIEFQPEFLGIAKMFPKDEADNT